ncbi:hypothetical protein CHLNCDRAFT_141375 [Chlorella variabilis]|uniref:Uncharacterized protein n=1 Tax=Chlorella variabilis TaxID=554065 RepID=E1ZSR5_CHLVA|nr:hypothetical protein CHLNCDRAFT_141375 [Chlorella variabilis]EFN51153.1 hypothetical protein CHLNCDRAFT_141375 [Chlorella variabilis]|eukprot:XP_005843255.1 hypothetical protein CHLNCDRAFT_141375 [Chlorella variabilis]
MRGPLRRALAAHAGLGRSYSVVAWGRNTEFQCGVSAALPLLLQAREVEALAGLPVASLTAGKTHSAGVLRGGEVLTWGEGLHGKLGHGCVDSAHVPHCVESLAGRVHVVAAALGRHHTLFLDSSGQAWATGENKEGQCGLGTPLEELARQQRRQYENTYLKPFVEHRERSAELEAAAAMYDAEMRSLIQQRSAWQRFEAAKGSDIAIPGLMPGQIASPVRLGRARQGIFSPLLPELAGLDAERIVQLSAGRLMSAAVTAGGEVWTFGGGQGGAGAAAGGAGLSSGPRPVDGVLAQVIRDNGGVVKVAAGGAFCVALTRSGRVVLWGAPGSGESAASAAAAAAAATAAAAAALPQRQNGRRRRPTARPGPAAPPQPQPQPQLQQQQQPAAAVEQEEVPNLRLRRQAGLLVAEVVDLPAMRDVAAGFSHIAMTDGASVWTIGRHTPATGAGAPDPLWLRPRRVMHRPDDGVASLAAGAFSTAAVTGAGELYLWGTLLTEDASAALLKKSEEEVLGHWAYSGTADVAATQWSGWEGLGGAEPRRVPGLHQVQHVSLGTHHALAVVA